MARRRDPKGVAPRARHTDPDPGTVPSGVRRSTLSSRGGGVSRELLVQRGASCSRRRARSPRRPWRPPSATPPVSVVETRSSPAGARCVDGVNAGSVETSSGEAKRQHEPASSEGASASPVPVSQEPQAAGAVDTGPSIRQIMARAPCHGTMPARTVANRSTAMERRAGAVLCWVMFNSYPIRPRMLPQLRERKVPVGTERWAPLGSSAVLVGA